MKVRHAVPDSGGPPSSCLARVRIALGDCAIEGPNDPGTISDKRPVASVPVTCDPLIPGPAGQDPFARSGRTSTTVSLSEPDLDGYGVYSSLDNCPNHPDPGRAIVEGGPQGGWCLMGLSHAMTAIQAAQWTLQH